MKVLMVLTALVLVLLLIGAYPMIPGSWDSQARSVAATTWHPATVAGLRSHVAELDVVDALVVMSGERVVLEEGVTALPINTRSVRKSVMSMLFGGAADRGLLDIGATLAELGLDDAKMPLTPTERSATIEHLLQARSGIFIEAAGETPEMKARRPQRGQFAPGERYYYNNWDFNTLGAIFERQTGLGIGDALADWFADPLGMQDFEPGHVIYSDAERSEHRQYVIFLSARDLARLGALMAQRGRWQGRQLLSEAWVARSTARYSVVPDQTFLSGYGYLWWLEEDRDRYWATGWGGQFMSVDPARGLVVVSRNDTGRRLGEIGYALNFGSQGRRDAHRRAADLAQELGADAELSADPATPMDPAAQGAPRG